MIEISSGARHSRYSGRPRRTWLSVAPAIDGAVTISLRRENLDGTVEKAEVLPVVRLRILSPAIGSVTDGAGRNVPVGMDTTLALEDLALGESRAFDVEIRGDVEARGANGKPLVWGTLSGRFEP
jgi:hypothetical protein